MPRSCLPALLCLLGAIVFFACPGGPGSNQGPDGGDAGVDGGPDGGGTDAGSTTPALSAPNQTLALTTQVSVGPVSSSGPGWVVIYADDGSGGLGAVLGHAPVANGTTNTLQVPLGQREANSAQLHAVLHVDQGTVGQFEYPGVDAPVTDGGVPVAAAFSVSVSPTTPDLLITASSQSFDGYVWESVSPASYQAQTIGTGSLNQSLTLKAGWRYQITNRVSSVHPLELLQIGSGGDSVLLSQAPGVNGSLESDSSIGWVEGSGGNVSFTVSPSLQSALNGYRCNIHTTVMRGAVSVQ